MLQLSNIDEFKSFLKDRRATMRVVVHDTVSQSENPSMYQPFGITSVGRKFVTCKNGRVISIGEPEKWRFRGDETAEFDLGHKRKVVYNCWYAPLA